MARLTLSEQVNKQASEISQLSEQLRQAGETNAHYLATTERQQLEIVALRKQVEELPTLRSDLEKTKEALKSKESSYGYCTSERERLESEVEQAHAMLDGVEGAPGREYEGEYGKRRRNVVARLAGAFLAIAKNRW